MKTDITHENEPEIVFLPLINGKRKRFGLMLTTLIPGIVLLTTAITDQPTIILSLIIKIFTIIIAMLVVFASIKEYKNPGSIKFMGFDTILVLTGLMIIAQGTEQFNPLKGFHPAHLYFIGGSIAIFKAVMFPEAKIKRGFFISNNEIKIKQGFFRPTKVITTNDVIRVEKSGSNLLFKRNSGVNESESLKGFEIPNQLLTDLMTAIKDSNTSKN